MGWVRVDPPKPGEFEDDASEANRQTASLAGLAAALVLVVAGLFLVNHLRDKSMVEDCLMSGRFNCDAVLAMGTP